MTPPTAIEGEPVHIVVNGLAPGEVVTLRASHGCSVLGLGNFHGEEAALSGLPVNLEKIPLETLSGARDWLAREPGVDPTRIAIVSVSKGAELALVAAATFPWVTAVGAFGAVNL